MLAMKPAFAQETVYNPNNCPCGIKITIPIDKLNFHKPRTDCTRGFGFCFKISKIILTCNPCNEIQSTLVPRMNGDIVEGFFKYDCGQMKLHLPRELAEDEMYKGENTSEFEIEEKSICLSGEKSDNPVWVKGGIYPVEIIGEELIIPVDLD